MYMWQSFPGPSFTGLWETFPCRVRCIGNKVHEKIFFLVNELHNLDTYNTVLVITRINAVRGRRRGRRTRTKSYVEQMRIVVAVIFFSSPGRFSAWSFIDVFDFELGKRFRKQLVRYYVITLLGRITCDEVSGWAPFMVGMSLSWLNDSESALTVHPTWISFCLEIVLSFSKRKYTRSGYLTYHTSLKLDLLEAIHHKKEILLYMECNLHNAHEIEQKRWCLQVCKFHHTRWFDGECHSMN